MIFESKKSYNKTTLIQTNKFGNCDANGDPMWCSNLLNQLQESIFVYTVIILYFHGVEGNQLANGCIFQ